jgi:predicted nucleic acid-binding protein
LGLRRAALAKGIPAGDRLLLDTSVLIAYFEPSDATHELAKALIDDFIRSGRNAAIVSAVTAMEVLVRPLRVAPAGAIHVHDFLTHTPNLTLVSVDLSVAREAASLRAAYSFKTPDALIIATGIVSAVGHLATNDAAWSRTFATMSGRIKVAEIRDYL